MTRDMYLGEPSTELRFPRPFFMLALSGGGYRGLYTAAVLANLEARIPHERPIGDYFDHISGTSVGALIAAGLALGVPAAALKKGIIKFGPLIFRRRLFRSGRGAKGGLLGSKFSSTKLREAILEILGDGSEKTRIGEIKKPIVLTATCATTKTPYIISNSSHSDEILNTFLCDALLASAAAPIFFPAVQIGSRSLVDGGLIANAPDLAAYTDVIRNRMAPREICRLLSIGTATPDGASVPMEIGARGALGWLMGDLVPLVLEAQERLIVEQITALMGSNYRRLSAVPSAHQAAALDLDSAERAATDTLLLLASDTVERFNRQDWQEYLNILNVDRPHDLPHFVSSTSRHS